MHCLLFLAQLAKRDRKYEPWSPFLLYSKDLQRLLLLHGLGDIAVRAHVYSTEDLQFEFVCSPSSEGYPVATRDAYAGGRRGSCPLCLIHGGQEGQELPSILNSFHFSNLMKRHFPAL